MLVRVKVNAVYEIPNGSEIATETAGDMSNPDLIIGGERLVIAGAMFSRIVPDGNKQKFVALSDCQEYSDRGISQPFLRVEISKLERGEEVG